MTEELVLGDRSVLKGNNISIENSGIGIASKDESDIVFQYIEIFNCRIAYTAFKKKPEFGPSHITISESRITQTELSFLLEEPSTIQYNGNKIEPNQNNFKDIIIRD